MPIYKVIKQNRIVEDFIPDKIARVVRAAGVTDTQAKKIASVVSEWITHQTQPTPTTFIRNEVISALQNIDPYVAGLFQWYEKSKDDMNTATR